MRRHKRFSKCSDVFVISLGIDRKDSVKVLDGITNTLSRDAWQQETTERSE